MSTIPLPPISEDWICYQGSDFVATVYVVDHNNVPIDLTGASAVGQVRSTPDQNGILLYTIASTGLSPNIVIDNVPNTLNITIPGYVSEAWNWYQDRDAAPFYSVFVTLSTGQVILAQKGNFVWVKTSTTLNAAAAGITGPFNANFTAVINAYNRIDLSVSSFTATLPPAVNFPNSKISLGIESVGTGTLTVATADGVAISNGKYASGALTTTKAGVLSFFSNGVYWVLFDSLTDF